MWWRFALLEGGSRVSARQPPYFLLLRQKKVSQEKATLLPASLPFAPGSLRCSPVGCAAELATRLVSASLRQLRRVRWTKHVRHGPHMPPHRLRASAQVEGSWGCISRRISEWNMPPAPIQQALEAMNLLLTPSPACGRGLG
ncbi:hypothetical protein F7P80_08850 [Comamonas kerstersii]|uniref:Uncharacterized protein n=1 Tax=Comamonas kerstersii TaxID=225992 RepID=A0A6A1R3G5_9BURK|nr:hypothetical protein F7P80_08850 [Comamonas kerstersii]